MEKIDILFLAFAIFVIITSCYICYLKAGINFLCENLAKHQVVMSELLEAMERQVNINDTQGEINKIICDELKIKIKYNINLDDSSTGGGKQSN
jgi:hypothetical protein